MSVTPEILLQEQGSWRKKLHLLTVLLDLAFCLLELQNFSWKSGITDFCLLLGEFDVTPLEIM